MPSFKEWREWCHWVPVLDVETVKEMKFDPTLWILAQMLFSSRPLHEDPITFLSCCSNQARGILKTKLLLAVFPPRIYSHVRIVGRDSLEIQEICSLDDVIHRYLGRIPHLGLHLLIMRPYKDFQGGEYDRYFFLCPGEGPVDPARALKVLYLPLCG